MAMLDYLKKRLVTPPSRQRGLKVGQRFGVPFEDYLSTGERDAILASSGMGKSYLCGVLMEETIENHGVLCVIDPEGEHFTLAERYPMLIIGGEQGNIPFDEAAIELYLEAMLEQGISAVFDLSEYVDAEQQVLYSLIVDALFNAEQKYRRKVRLVVEEAQIYAPQRGTGQRRKVGDPIDSITASQKVAKRGRKRALDSLWATQRPASINKDILSQCNRFWFGGITSEQDYKAIRPFLNEAGISFADIKSLKPGQFFFHGKRFGQTETKLIQVRKRLCKHAGSTPEMGQTMSFKATSDRSLDNAIGALADRINELGYNRSREQSELERLQHIISKMEDENRRLLKELEEERMATKVIDRLGRTPPSSSSGTRRRSASAGAPAASRGRLTVMDDVADTARRRTGYELMDDGLPEKIYLDR